MHIETNRLIIRNFKDKDVAGLYEYLAAPPVHCFYSEKVNSYEEAVKKVKEKQNGDGHGNCYAVCLRDTDFIIGEIFTMKEHPDTYSIGWNFNLKYGRKGYAKEAAQAVINNLFENDARRIYAYAEDDNLPSQKLCERLGMRREGLFVEFISFVNNPDGTPLYENTYQYAVLKKEWKTLN